MCMMSNESIFCCGEQVSCVNYRSDYSVHFGHVFLSCDERFENKAPNHVSMVFVLKGKVQVVCEGKKDEEVEEGEMFLLSPLLKSQVKCVEDVEILVFTSDHPKEYSAELVRSLKKECEKLNYHFNKLPIRQPLDAFFELLECYLKDRMACGHLLEEKQEELFILLNNYYTKSELELFLYPLAMLKDSDFKEIVIQNSLRAKGVQELIDMCGYTTGGFKKIFKEMFDEPVYQWMLQQKADKLRYRLAEDDVNLKGLIDEFGFSSPAHFTKFCKKWLGKTPTQFMDEVKSQREQINL